jgi:hypothetical protein
MADEQTQLLGGRGAAWFSARRERAGKVDQLTS